MELDTLKPPRPSGFTLVELLVALSLLSVLVLLAGLLLGSARGLALALGEPSREPPSPLPPLQDDLNRLQRGPPGEEYPELLLDPVEGLRFRRLSRDESGWMYPEELHIPPLTDGQLLRISRPAGGEGPWVTNRIRSGLRDWRLRVISEGEALDIWPPADGREAPLPRRLAAGWETNDAQIRTGSLLIPAALLYKPE